MIPLFKVNMSPEASNAVAGVLESGMIGEGPKVEEFTEKLQELFDHNGVVCTSSCTSALEIALRLCSVRGHPVVSTPFTFPATNCAIANEGGLIEWTAVDPDTLCVETEATIRKAIETKARAVVITLVGGLVPKNFDHFYWALKTNYIPLILDCAHALTTTYKGKHISHWADFTCYSFQSIKHLTTGDGGALVIENETLYEDAKKLKWFGIDRKVPGGKTRLEHQMESSIRQSGYKAHMNDIAAAIGLANLPGAIGAIRISQDNAAYFDDFISTNLFDKIEPLYIGPESTSSRWAYGFKVKYNECEDGSYYREDDKRLAFVMEKTKALNELGVAASPLWKMNNEHYCFSRKPFLARQPAAIFIPSGFWVRAEERKQITAALVEVFGDN